MKTKEGYLRSGTIPRVSIVKDGTYSQEDESENPDDEVDIMARINKAQMQQSSSNPSSPKLHGIVMEGLTPYAIGSPAQTKALEISCDEWHARS